MPVGLSNPVQSSGGALNLAYAGRSKIAANKPFGGKVFGG
jgi:hypothetical protein